MNQKYYIDNLGFSAWLAHTWSNLTAYIDHVTIETFLLGLNDNLFGLQNMRRCQKDKIYGNQQPTFATKQELVINSSFNSWITHPLCVISAIVVKENATCVRIDLGKCREINLPREVIIYYYWTKWVINLN